MSGTKTRENVLLVILILLLAGVSYYRFFYAPLQSELSSVAAQTAEIREETQTEAAKAVEMASMQKELDALAAAGQTTEVADYDNGEAVMTQLSGILASASDYSVSFGIPARASDGTYRRTIAVSFSAPGYETAKTIVQSIAQSRWRTLINSVSFVSGGSTSSEDLQAGILSGQVSVDLSVTYFERASSAG